MNTVPLASTLPTSTISINVQSSETRLMPCACAFRALGICLPQLASGNPSAHAIHPAEMYMTPKLELVLGLKSCPPCVCTHPAKTEPANPTPITGLWKTLPHKFCQLSSLVLPFFALLHQTLTVIL